MRMKPFLALIATVLVASACAPTQMAAPPAASPMGGPQIAAVGLSQDQGGSYVTVPQSTDGNYYVAAGRWVRFSARTTPANSRIVKVVNRVDIWRELARGKTVTGTRTFESELGNIANCCTEVYSSWMSPSVYPGDYATFTMWVVDEAGHTSNAVIAGPIVVK